MDAVQQGSVNGIRFTLEEEVENGFWRSESSLGIGRVCDRLHLYAPNHRAAGAALSRAVSSGWRFVLSDRTREGDPLLAFIRLPRSHFQALYKGLSDCDDYFARMTPKEARAEVAALNLVVFAPTEADAVQHFRLRMEAKGTPYLESDYRAAVAALRDEHACFQA